MLDTFRKRDNVRPGTSGQPGTRPAPLPSALQKPSAAPVPEPHLEPAAVKPALLETPPAPSAATPPAPAPVTAPAAVVDQPSSVQPSVARMTVGPDIKLKGAEITDCDTLIVEGQVDASMDSRVVEIAENGVMRGKVQVDIAEIRGRFEGELTVNKQLVIRETGRVAGKIRYSKIRIDEGGEVSGDIAATQTSAESPRGLPGRARETTGQALAASHA